MMRKILTFVLLITCQILIAQKSVTIYQTQKSKSIPEVSLTGTYDYSCMADSCKVTIVWNNAKGGWGLESFYYNDSTKENPKWVRIKEGAYEPDDAEGALNSYFYNPETNILFGPKTTAGWGVKDTMRKYYEKPAQLNPKLPSVKHVKTAVIDADGGVDSLDYDHEYIITKWNANNATIYLPTAEGHAGEWIIINMVTCDDFKLWINSASPIMLSNTSINFKVQENFMEFNMSVYGYAKIVSDGQKWIAFGIEGAD